MWWPWEVVGAPSTGLRPGPLGTILRTEPLVSFLALCVVWRREWVLELSFLSPRQGCRWHWVGGRKSGLCPFLSPIPVVFCVLRLCPGRKWHLGTGMGQGLVGELGSPPQGALCSRVLERGRGAGWGRETIQQSRASGVTVLRLVGFHLEWCCVTSAFSVRLLKVAANGLWTTSWQKCTLRGEAYLTWWLSVIDPNSLPDLAHLSSKYKYINYLNKLAFELLFLWYELLECCRILLENWK